MLLATCQSRDQLVEFRFIEFGTIIEISFIDDDFKHAQKLQAEIERRLKVYRGQWHAWEESDLSRFNLALEQQGQAAIASSLSALLNFSQDYYRRSGGVFNPALGKLIDAHGFHHQQPQDALIAAIKADIPNMDQLSIKQGIAYSTNPHLQIDLGGIAKGYAIQLISAYLDENGIHNYIVNAGGDLQTSGSKHGKPWKIGIQNPFSGGAIASLQLSGRHSLFTSGNYQRKYYKGGKLKHHIIDPLTGEPSKHHSSATILSTDSVVADVAATAMMINGLERHQELAQALEINDYMIISDTREILISHSFFQKIKIKANWPIKIIY